MRNISYFQVDDFLYWESNFKNGMLVNYLFTSGSEHIYWILDLGGEVHSIWVLWTMAIFFWNGEGKGTLFGQV